MTDRPTCIDCFFFSHRHDHYTGTDTIGECRAFPPKEDFTFPLVRGESHWCGELAMTPDDGPVDRPDNDGDIDDLF